MKTREQKIHDIISFIGILSDIEKHWALVNLLKWQCVEIGEDVSLKYDDIDENIVDIYWSSCGISLLGRSP